MGRPCAVAGPGQSGHVGKVVFDVRLVESAARFERFGRGRSLVHEGQRGVVAALRADADARDAARPQFAQLRGALLQNVAYAGEHADRPYLRQKVADAVGEPDESSGAQHEGVGADEKNPPGPRLIAGDDPQIGLDLLRRGDPEAEVILPRLQSDFVERTEFAGVVRAADRDLQQYRAGLEGRPPDCPREVEGFGFFHRFSYFCRPQDSPDSASAQELIRPLAAYARVSFCGNEPVETMKKNEKNPPRPTLSPACALIGRFGSRWALLVLLTLHEGGVLRFGELVRAVPGGISETDALRRSS